MFTQAVGMTASDWPVSRVVKRSQTIEILLLFYLLQKLPLAVNSPAKSDELCSDADFKASVG